MVDSADQIQRRLNTLNDMTDTAAIPSQPPATETRHRKVRIKVLRYNLLNGLVWSDAWLDAGTEHARVMEEIIGDIADEYEPPRWLPCPPPP